MFYPSLNISRDLLVAKLISNFQINKDDLTI